MVFTIGDSLAAVMVALAVVFVFGVPLSVGLLVGATLAATRRS